MKRTTRILVPVAAAAALAFGAAAQAQAYDMEINSTPTAEAMTFDLFVMRPLSLAGTVLGTAIFVVSLPVDLITMNFADPAQRLVIEPAHYTFRRPLGDLD